MLTNAFQVFNIFKIRARKYIQLLKIFDIFLDRQSQVWLAIVQKPVGSHSGTSSGLSQTSHQRLCVGWDACIIAHWSWEYVYIHETSQELIETNLICLRSYTFNQHAFTAESWMSKLQSNYDLPCSSRTTTLYEIELWAIWLMKILRVFTEFIVTHHKLLTKW